MSSTPVVHDHFVLLLNQEEFENVPIWLTENFTIIDGGTHAKGSSRNKLIVFKDGTYLELFNWTKQPLEFLAWADKKPGLIDFALTTMPPVTAEQNYATVSKNISHIDPQHRIGVTYEQPLVGGRKRGDGKEVKWKNSRPSFDTAGSTIDASYFPHGRVDVPFFCHDVTDRTVRVPFDDEKITTHPCGAVGIDTVDVIVPAKHGHAYDQYFGAILDVQPEHGTHGGDARQESVFPIGVPHPTSPQPVYVKLSAMSHDDLSLKERGIGIGSLTLRLAENASGPFDIVPLAKSGIGATVKLKKIRDLNAQ